MRRQPSSTGGSYFALLTVDEQRASIRKMATSGIGPATIAAATAVHIDMVRAIIATTQVPLVRAQ